MNFYSNPDGPALISFLKLSSVMSLFVGQSIETVRNHREMLLVVVDILSPNISKIKPPTVTNQPVMK
jgi:hypothetical protein